MNWYTFDHPDCEIIFTPFPKGSDGMVPHDWLCHSVGIEGGRIIFTSGKVLSPHVVRMNTTMALEMASQLVARVRELKDVDWDKFEKDCKTG